MHRLGYSYSDDLRILVPAYPGYLLVRVSSYVRKLVASDTLILVTSDDHDLLVACLRNSMSRPAEES